jgi:Abortive infection alpha
MTEEANSERENGSLIGAAPGLLRIAAGAGLRTAGWTVNAYMRVGSRVLEAAASGESTTELLRSAGADARDYARRLLGLGSTPPAEPPPGGSPESNGAPDQLRERGAELLRKSADVTFDEESHPAYERILDDLAPDEGRILRLLATKGPQPAVDVRTGVLPVNVGSELIAPGLNMIGQEAGCRRVERVPAYLNNLNRLGLIWFSREPLDDPLRYQVVEAQPEVVEALKNARLSRTVRRSIHLTPFGEDFCATVLPEPESRPTL